MVNKISILNTILCKVKFSYGVETEYSANIIADKIWAQCNNVVRQFELTEEVLRHK